MKHYCHYHPISPAKWHCSKCHSYFDNACAHNCDEKVRTATCPHCNVPMQYVHAKAIDIPFWQNLKYFFLMPLKAELLLALCLLTVASNLTTLNPLLMLPGSIIALLITSQLGMAITRSVAQMPKSRVSLNQLLKTKSFMVDMAVSSILLGVSVLLYALNQSLGALAALFVATLLFILLPAWLMSSALAQNIQQSFSVQNLYAPIATMGQKYFVVVGYLALGTIAVMVVADFLAQHTPNYLFSPIVFGLSAYFAFCFFTMLGYVIAEFDSFNTSDHHANHTAEHINKDTPLSFDTNLDIHLKQGRYEEAIELLEAELKRHSDSEFRRNQFLKLCLALNDWERVERYVHATMRMLISRNQIPFAASIIEKLKQRNPNFRLHDLPVSLELAKRFQKRKEVDMVLWLAEDAHTRFDSEPELAELYLMAAKSLVSNMTNAPLAAFYLRFIIDHFPNEKVAAAAKILQAHLEKYSTAV